MNVELILTASDVSSGFGYIAGLLMPARLLSGMVLL